MKVRVHDTAEMEWTRIGDAYDNDLDQERLNSHIRCHEKGSDTDMQLSEVAYIADTFVPPHWHDEAEIIYVAEGELHLGSRVLRAGSSIYIDKEAVYSFRAGPEGLKMLIFRARGGSGYHPLGEQPGH